MNLESITKELAKIGAKEVLIVLPDDKYESLRELLKNEVSYESLQTPYSPMGFDPDCGYSVQMMGVVVHFDKESGCFLTK